LKIPKGQSEAGNRRSTNNTTVTDFAGYPVYKCPLAYILTKILKKDSKIPKGIIRIRKSKDRQYNDQKRVVCTKLDIYVLIWTHIL